MATKDFTNTKTTKDGTPVKGVRYNSVVKYWLGSVQDPKSYLPDKWTTITWNTSGRCVNRNRPELDLI